MPREEKKQIMFQGLTELEGQLDVWRAEQIDASRKGGIDIEQFRLREHAMVVDLARKNEKPYKWVFKRVTNETAKPSNALGVIPTEEDDKVSGDPLVESLFTPIDVGAALKSELVDLFEIDGLLNALFDEGGKGVLFERQTVKAVYEHAWKEGYLKEGKRIGTQEPQPGNFFIGNPGIGKSWSLLMLLRMALEHGELVYYNSVKKGIHLLFIPNTHSGMRRFGSLEDCSTRTNRGYTVLWLSAQAISIVPRLRTCLWIIDPGEVTQGLELPKTLGMAPGRECRTYVAVSDNRKHFANYVEKDKWIRHIVDMAGEEEIKAILASGCWKVDADADVVRDRWAVVGGAMRYLENEGRYNEFVSRIEAETLPLEDIKKLLTTDRPYAEGEEGGTGSGTQSLLRHSIHMKLCANKLGDPSSHYEFLSHYTSGRHRDQIRELTRSISFGTLTHSMFEPLVGLDLGKAKTELVRLVALSEEDEYANARDVSFNSLNFQTIYPSTEAQAIEAMKSGATNVGTLLVFPKCFKMMDFAVKLKEKLWMLVQATTFKSHSYKMNSFCEQFLKELSQDQCKEQFIMVWAVPADVAPKFQFTLPQQVEGQDLQKCKSIRQFTWFVRDGIADVGSHLGATVDIFEYLDNVDGEFKKRSVLEDEFKTIDKHEIFTGPLTTSFIHGSTQDARDAVKKASASIKPRGDKPVTSLGMKRTILKFFPFSMGLTSKTRKELLMLMFKYHYAKPVLKHIKENGPLPGAYDKQHRLSAYVEILCGITEVAQTPFDSTKQEGLITYLNEALKLQEAGGAEEGEGALVAKMRARVSPSLKKSIKESYYGWRKLA